MFNVAAAAPWKIGATSDSEAPARNSFSFFFFFADILFFFVQGLIVWPSLPLLSRVKRKAKANPRPQRLVFFFQGPGRLPLLWHPPCCGSQDSGARG